MYFRCTRLTQQIDDPLAGRATHDAVVYQDHSLSGNDTVFLAMRDNAAAETLAREGRSLFMG